MLVDLNCHPPWAMGGCLQGAGVSPGMLEDAVVPRALPLMRVVDPLMVAGYWAGAYWCLTS